MEQHPHATEDPDTIVYGAHEYRRVENARRVLVTNGAGVDVWACPECERWVGDSWAYCPTCGRRLQNPEEGDWA